MADDSQGLSIARFLGTTDTYPRNQRVSWQTLAAFLTRHTVRRGKGGPAWCPALYRENARRGNAGIESLSCLVLDFDDGSSPDSFISAWTRLGLAFVVHSTYSHAPDSPRWRAVFPLTEPVPVADWKRTYTLLATELGRGAADPACKDPARLYYLPSHPPGITPLVHRQVEGNTLDCPPCVPPPARRAGGGTQALLQRHGWTVFKEEGSVVHLTRPGKTEGISGTLGFPDGDAESFYCYTSGAPPLEAGRLYLPQELKALLEPTAPLAAFHLTDTGNAERLITRHGADLRYANGLGWRVWDGARWSPGEYGVLTRAQETVRAFYAEAGALLKEAHGEVDTDRRRALVVQAERVSRFALKSESTPLLKAMVEQAGWRPAVQCDADQFVLQPWRVPFPNGTWDKGEFRPHKREDYCEYLIATQYDVKTDRSEWVALLRRMTGNDADLARTLQEVAGYVLSGASSLRVLPWLYGPKGTGKSTFAELLQTALGPTGKVLDGSLLSGDRDTERLGSAVRGMRAVFLAEAGRKRLDAELLKMMAGSDRIPARELYSKHTYSVVPTWAVIAVSNDAPNVHAYDDALRDRVIALPFVCPLDEGGRLTFSGGGRLEEVRRNPESPLLLGFIAWAMDGLAQVYASQSLHRAAVVEQHTRQFWEDADPLTPFWEGLDSRAIESGMPASALHNAYLSWHQNHRMMGKLLQGKYFAAACRAAGLEEYRTNSARGWKRCAPLLQLAA